MQTLNQIADELGVSPQTLRNRIEKYQTSTGKDFYSTGQKDPLDSRKTVYPDDAVTELLQFIDPTYQPPHPEPEAVQALVTVESGNHRTALNTPEISLNVDLAQFRDVESISFDDPLALAEQFLEAADVLEAGMQSDIERQRKQLKATEQARKQIEAKAQELSIQRHIYSDRINDLASRQTVSTADLQKALEDLQGLGKPNAG